MISGATSVLDTLDEDARRRFEAAWRAGKPEPIERFLPAADHRYHESTLVELVLIELEFLWRERGQAGQDATIQQPPRIEHYLERFPQLTQPATLVKLLRHEFRV